VWLKRLAAPFLIGHVAFFADHRSPRADAPRAALHAVAACSRMPA
jgi:hypothetical protein